MYPNLNDLLNYRNDKIIARYNIDYPNTEMSGEEAWQELMKFIWLSHKHKIDRENYPENINLDFSCVIHEEMSDIDNMWHTFLLFTKDYHQFCHTYLNGAFLHHDPLSVNNDLISEEQYALELTCYLSYIHEHLGEETLVRWFK
ncbi:hypothetical protein EP47_01455 [Legionella norrlandica]|uniref:Uncharacterized protein n=1 Tax=Legionella norrlandica TaxID=1498499 RepID=A0A0A2SR89_9GAMM|nr:hypothetical protein EP47_01455 [Legionella norrlandica]